MPDEAFHDPEEHRTIDVAAAKAGFSSATGYRLARDPSLPSRKSAPPVTSDFDPFPGTRVTHRFAFMRKKEAIPGRRSAGSLGWAGVCNTHYWLDPARGIAAVIMTQSLPFVEERSMATYAAYENAVYAGL